MATAKKAPAKKTAPKKAAPKTAKVEEFSLQASTEKAVNIYLGILGMIGKSLDTVQENFESARKENDKRVKDLEKRGAKLRKKMEKRVDCMETPDFESIVEDAKARFNRVQNQVEEAVENFREKLNSAKSS